MYIETYPKIWMLVTFRFIRGSLTVKTAVHTTKRINDGDDLKDKPIGILDAIGMALVFGILD